jgi:recombination protein RecA
MLYGVPWSTTRRITKCKIDSLEIAGCEKSHNVVENGSDFRFLFPYTIFALMFTATNLRAQIEAKLSNRVPAAFSLKIKHPPELFSTGIAAADAILEGGIPLGSITEITGVASTGRTSFVLSIVSGITQSGAACAWVDVHDALSPESAAASGVVLERLLWLRTKPTTITEREVAQAQVNQRHLPRRQIVHYGGSPHPRNETRGIDSAVSLLFKGEGGLLRDKTVGTPGRSNRPLSDRKCAESLSRVQHKEQAAYDRLPARRGEYFLKELAGNKQTESQPLNIATSKRERPTSEKPWLSLEQALKATDLLLQTGGFATVVLDMSDLLPQHAMRIPLASWHRFRLAAERARTALILLTQSPCTGSCAALVLRCEPSGTEPWSNGETPLFQNQHYTLIREQKRNEGFTSAYKKKPSRAEWEVQTEWTRMR